MRARETRPGDGLAQAGAELWELVVGEAADFFVRGIGEGARENGEESETVTAGDGVGVGRGDDVGRVGDGAEEIALGHIWTADGGVQFEEVSATDREQHARVLEILRAFLDGEMGDVGEFGFEHHEGIGQTVIFAGPQFAHEIAAEIVGVNAEDGANDFDGKGGGGLIAGLGKKVWRGSSKKRQVQPDRRWRMAASSRLPWMSASLLVKGSNAVSSGSEAT